ncbi:MAG: nucleotidyltransferase domain-containing protein [Methanolinea sp.]|nr:nucleotidyltransferase domain-containing protein [Methanolinea sp.]
MRGKPIRLRDFIEDDDGWLYAVSTYDNKERVGCLLRYVPDSHGNRVNAAGDHYRKVDFQESFDLIGREKPEYLDLLHRVPIQDVRRILKPEEEIPRIYGRDHRIHALMSIFQLPPGTLGCTGSFLCGLENAESDIDLVVYGRQWFHAQEILQYATLKGRLPAITEEIWKKIYEKRKPEISFEEFLIHEKRKWNRGQIGHTYFDLLFTRSYKALNPLPSGRGEVKGPRLIEARVTDASLAHDSPAVYRVEHGEISRVLSFTHTYSGQALGGERIQARGICERHGDELWLIVGTTREARGEYIRSLTLLGEE